MLLLLLAVVVAVFLEEVAAQVDLGNSQVFR